MCFISHAFGEFIRINKFPEAVTQILDTGLQSVTPS